MNKKFTYEYVRDYIASFGYALLSKEYNNCRTRLKIKCDNGKNDYFMSCIEDAIKACSE